MVVRIKFVIPYGYIGHSYHSHKHGAIIGHQVAVVKGKESDIGAALLLRRPLMADNGAFPDFNED